MAVPISMLQIFPKVIQMTIQLYVTSDPMWGQINPKILKYWQFISMPLQTNDEQICNLVSRA